MFATTPNASPTPNLTITPEYKNLSHVEEIIIGGGGVAAVAYAGVLDELIATQNLTGFSLDNIKKTGGTSAGAVAAMLLSFNYSAQEIFDVLKQVNFNDVTASKNCLLRLPLIGTIADAYSLFKSFGLYKHDALYNIIKKMVREFTKAKGCENADATFADLKALGCKDLYVISCKIYNAGRHWTTSPVVFSTDETPDTSVALAVLASGCIPLFLECVRLKLVAPGKFIKVSDESGDVFCDGGLLQNYPLELFDSPPYPAHDLSAIGSLNRPSVFNPNTLGFYLETRVGIDEIILPTVKSTPTDHAILQEFAVVNFLLAIINGLYKSNQNAIFNVADNIARTIFVDRKNILATDFNISDEGLEQLSISGRASTQDFIKLNSKTLIAQIEQKSIPATLAIVNPGTTPGTLFNPHRVQTADKSTQVSVLENNQPETCPPCCSIL
jgi:NTE family protein